MARAPLPKSKLKLRRRRARVRIGGLIALAVLVIAGGLIASLYAPFWRIAHLNVEGSQSVSQQLIESQVAKILGGSYFAVFPKDNALLYPKSEIIASLKTRFPALSQVNVSLTDLTALDIKVSEYGPYALWCGEAADANAPCYLMDQDGTAYATAMSYEGSGYVRYYGAATGKALPRQYLSIVQFRALRALLSEIENNVAPTQLVSVVVDANNDVRATFGAGFTLIFSLNDDGGSVFKHFVLAQTAEPFAGHTLADFEYLDLRFGDKLYYKLR
jgi:cell division septal protein FtsQ